MKKPAVTYAATLAGVTFETKSVRPLTHAVISLVGRLELAHYRQSVAEFEAHVAAGSWGSWTLAELEVSLDRDRKALAEREVAFAEGRPWSISFHSRADLAAKECERRNGDAWFGRATVVAVEVIR
jgi:hypothetical protein